MATWAVCQYLQSSKNNNCYINLKLPLPSFIALDVSVPACSTCIPMWDQLRAHIDSMTPIRRPWKCWQHWLTRLLHCGRLLGLASDRYFPLHNCPTYALGTVKFTN